MEDQSRRARNSEFVNSIQLPFPDESDINAQVVNIHLSFPSNVAS